MTYPKPGTPAAILSCDAHWQRWGSNNMVQFSGHFDGRVITPDEPVEIPVNTPLWISIEPAPAQQSEGVDWTRLLDLASKCAIQGPADLAWLNQVQTMQAAIVERQGVLPDSAPEIAADRMR